jgi:hypothetical protein
MAGAGGRMVVGSAGTSSAKAIGDMATVTTITSNCDNRASKSSPAQSRRTLFLPIRGHD